MGVTVGLVMIVRDEASVLPRLAESVLGVVDRWTIVDTGSSDATVEVAGELFAGLPGEVVAEEWRGFGGSRNSALRRGELTADWLLLLDADETLGGSVDRLVLTDQMDAVLTEVRTANVSYWLPRLVRSGAGWQWRGRTHECLVGCDGPSRLARAPGWWVDHHGDGGSRSDKYERDLVLLGEDWRESPGDPRTAFYLARTYDDMSRPGKAAEWYRTRLSLAGWEEERWYALWRLGACLLATASVDEGRVVLERAWRARRWRAEPLVTLSESFRQGGLWSQAWRACQRAFASTTASPEGRGRGPSDDMLFIDTATYRWRVAYEASIVAWYVNEQKKGRLLCDYLLGLPDLPAPIRSGRVPRGGVTSRRLRRCLVNLG